MELMQLPLELLLLIFGHLESDFFRQDVGRLAVSKKWYNLAWGVLVRDLQFTESSLLKFTADDAALARCQPNVAAVTLCLERLDDSSESPSLPDDAGTRAPRLAASLSKLATTLQQCPRMRVLDVKARIESPGPSEDYLMAEPVADLLSLRHLTSLDLDTASCPLVQTWSSHVHLCRSINSLLPSLRRLRCQMESICERLLALPPGDEPLALEDVVVNLSQSIKRDAVISYRYSKRCGELDDTGFLELRRDMENRATALVARLRQPRIVRVTTRDSPISTVYAFNAITGRRFRMSMKSNWDAVGRERGDPEKEWPVLRQDWSE